MNTVVIIGGGASGMAAAITASEDKNNNVILLERQQRVGKKLLSTGNGRCNLTNTGASPEHYHGSQPGFADAVLSRFTPEDTLHFFDSLGLAVSCEYGGRVYPQSNSANSVVDVLRFALMRDNITVKTSCPARRIEKRGEGFAVFTDEGSISADFVIVSCGGAAGAKVGGVHDGYELLKPLGHKCTPLLPSLVQLITDPTYPRALKGVRVMAKLRLENDGETVAQSSGELQFTETGLSGPAAFDISRAAAEIGRGVIRIDLSGGADIEAKLHARIKSNPTLCADDALTGVLHNRLGKMALVSVCLDMAEDNRWSVHLFTLNKAAVVSAPDKTVQVSVISQSAVGSSGGRFFINIIQRGKVPYMASRTLLAVCGKGMDSYDFILFR